ncbi:hypothetical protein NDU88_006812, partial [Pleurodeles waltl]
SLQIQAVEGGRDHGAEHGARLVDSAPEGPTTNFGPDAIPHRGRTWRSARTSGAAGTRSRRRRGPSAESSRPALTGDLRPCHSTEAAAPGEDAGRAQNRKWEKGTPTGVINSKQISRRKYLLVTGQPLLLEAKPDALRLRGPPVLLLRAPREPSGVGQRGDSFMHTPPRGA